MSLQHLQDIVLEILHAMNTPFSKTAHSCVKQGKWEELASLKADPQGYTAADHENYRLDNFVCSLLKKCSGLPTGVDTAAAAQQAWEAAERQCFQTNRRLYEELDSGHYESEKFFRRVRGHFYKLVGKAPTDLEGRFGPGSVFEKAGRYVSIPDKIASTPTLTAGASSFVYLHRKTAWSRLGNLFHVAPSDLSDLIYLSHSRRETPILLQTARESDYETVKGNRWDSVPKNCLTDRSIGIEPGLNVYYQLGIGREMRRNLQRQGLLLVPNKQVGVFSEPDDVSESQAIHRNLARKGSVDGSVATIDAKQASDTLAIALVERACGDAWFKLLCELRSPFTQMQGKWVKLEKFSSMGNGFTFELETAIFAAIALTVAESMGIDLQVGENFSVYGDDIIVPTEMASAMVTAMKYCGIEVNSSKTFLEGPFRESCGGDFFNGYPVRGLYLKAIPSSPGDWIVFYNLTQAMAQYTSVGRALHMIRDRIPSSLRNYGPSSLGDVVLHHPFWERKASIKRRDDIRSIRVTVPVIEDYPLIRWGVDSIVASKLYGLTGDKIAFRGDPISFSTEWVNWG